MSEPADELGAEPVADAAADETEAWAGPSQEEWQQLTQAVGYIGQVFQQQQQPPERPQVDPYDDNFQDQLDRYMDQRLQQQLSPIANQYEEMKLQQAEEQARDILHDCAVRDGEFDADSAFRRANQLLPEMNAKYGYTTRAVEAALEAGAAQQREFEQQVGEAYHQRKVNELAGLRGVPREQPANGATAAAQLVTHEGGDEFDLLRAYFPSS